MLIRSLSQVDLEWVWGDLTTHFFSHYNLKKTSQRFSTPGTVEQISSFWNVAGLPKKKGGTLGYVCDFLKVGKGCWLCVFFLGGGASESWVSFLYNASHLHSESCGTSRGKSVHGPDLGPTKKTHFKGAWKRMANGETVSDRSWGAAYPILKRIHVW